MAAPQLQTFEEGKELAQALKDGLVPEAKRPEAEAALADLQSRLEAEKETSAADQLKAQNEARLRDLSSAINTIADNPVGDPVLDPKLSTSRLGRVTPPAPNEPWVLANQARERGVDVNSGAALPERLGQGLAGLKDPQLRFSMLDSHYRKQLNAAGIQWPETVPTVMVEQQTGQLAYVRPITEDDHDDNPDNIGRTRLTLVDPVGLELGDMAEWLPSISVAAGETAGAVVAGLLKSPQAAAWASSTITAAIEFAASPLKDKLLRDYYGVTDEELEKYSNPDEALHQAMLAGGLDLAVGQGMILTRAVRNLSSKRTLTEADYESIVKELDEVRAINAEFKRATGETIEDNILFVEAASKKMDTVTGQSIGTTAQNLAKRMSAKWKRIFSTANDVTRFKLSRGFRTISNRAVEEGADGSVSRLGVDDNGLLIPNDQITRNAEEIIAVTRKDEGVDYAINNLREGSDEATRALDDLHNSVSTAHYGDVQQIAANDVQRAVLNEELQWAHFKSFLEPNATGTEYGIKLVNGRNSPVRRALGGIEREAQENLSQSMGDASQRFAQDMAALRGDTLDIMQMQRLRSDLLRAKRKVANGTDTSGWTANELDSVIDALDDTIRTQDWVRASTGRKVPGVRSEALPRWQMARESTDYMNNMARRSSIQDMTDTIQVYDGGTGRRFGERRRFTMQPAQVKATLFEPGNAGPLKDLIEMSGGHPGMRAALADELEGIYKGMALNADGTFARGGYNRFMSEYGDHAEALFGPTNAARITNADQLARRVDELNMTAKKVEDAYKATFGDAVDPQKVGANGVVRTIMSSSNVTARQARTLFNRIAKVDPSLHAALRAEMSQYLYGQLATSSVQLKSGNAIRMVLDTSADKISAVMGPQYLKDLRAIANFTELVDLSDLARGTAEPVQAAWLQVTRSVFGPLSRKQRFMTAANRVLRSTNARHALNVMADPNKLRGFVQLGKLDPSKLPFWQLAGQLGLRGLFEDNGLVPPRDLDEMKIREESMRNLAQGGPI
jgi:hypothetical protein